MQNKSRTLINLIGMPSLLGIIYLGDLFFTTFIYIVILLGTIEISKICNDKNYSVNVFWLYAIYLFMYVSHLVNFTLIDVKEIFILLVILLFIAQIIKKDNKPLASMSITLFVFIWIAVSLDCAIHIRNMQDGMSLMYCIFLSVWMCDSAAYIFGKNFGKAKILPHISPNKTWVGTLSGYIFSSLLIYFLISFDFIKIGNYLFNIQDAMMIGVIVGVFGQAGDFFESMIKREFKIKDSGTLLQGHGGILDRFDSLLFVIPSFYLYIKFIL